ncbi:MAG: putative zinc-binding protein [Rhodoferax sp.]|nr:putative zinc-binding protein [Rhodoferax sp.]
MTRRKANLALVYACSGCSSAAQLANHVAVQLDRQGVAEMSCIAGVGGDVPSLVRTATSGRAIVALDGCALACVKKLSGAPRRERGPLLPAPARRGQKQYHADFDPTQAQQVFEQVRADLLEASTFSTPGTSAQHHGRP